MPFPKKVSALLVFAIALMPVVALLTCARIDISSRSYGSYADALHAGALGESVWLPMGLPSSATSIRETHDVDTNEVWFSYIGSSADAPCGCARAELAEIRLPRPRKYKEVSRFTEDLQTLLRSGAAQLHRCRGEEYDYDLAIDPRNGHAYGWSLGDSR